MVAVLTTWSVDSGGRTDLVCDQCGNEVTNQEPAVRTERLSIAAKNQGWRDTAQGGHLCPDCVPTR
jgi:hypothetical protein